MIKAIIFDLDGTLCNTVEDIRTGVNAMLTRLGYKTRSRADILKFINNGARALVTRSLPKDVQDVEFIVDTALDVYQNEYAKCYCEFTEPYRGIEYMVSELKMKGYKIAVLSNKQDVFVKNICDKLFGKKTFNFIMGNTSDFPPKPDPASYEYVSKMLGVKPNLTVYVGDSDVDVKTAQNAGAEFIGCDWGYRGEDVLREMGASRIAMTPDDIMTEIAKIEDELEATRLEKKLAKKVKKPKAEKEESKSKSDGEISNETGEATDTEEAPKKSDNDETDSVSSTATEENTEEVVVNNTKNSTEEGLSEQENEKK
jgi:phosphoglycolate phosphatase